MDLSVCMHISKHIIPSNYLVHLAFPREAAAGQDIDKLLYIQNLVRYLAGMLA